MVTVHKYLTFSAVVNALRPFGVNLKKIQKTSYKRLGSTEPSLFGIAFQIYLSSVVGT